MHHILTDSNVEVIYVSPVPVNDEGMQYYSKLLALRPAVESGNVEDQAELNDRYKIVIPEAIKSFPVSTTYLLRMPMVDISILYFCV